METKVMTPRKGIPGSTLKIIAIIVMLIDHIGAVVLEHYMIFEASNGRYDYYTVYYIDRTLRLIGRLGFPIFCFLLIQGFIYTHNRWKYLANLLLFALISEIPFNLAIAGSFFSKQYQNVFFTLALGLIAVIGINASENKNHWNIICKILAYPAFFIFGPVALYFSLKWFPSIYSSIPFDVSLESLFIAFGLITGILLSIAGFFINAEKRTSLAFAIYAGVAAVISAEYLMTDYAGSGVITIIAIYLVRNMPYWFQGIIACSILTMMQTIEASSFFIVIPLCFYNGKRGIGLKYFFYAFYPVHLTILYLICLFMGTV